MAVYEAGYKNVVSVPNGSNNFKWIDHCWEWLQGVKEIIVFADNDEPGKAMADTIKRRLKNVKILIPERKDANEVLFFEGKKAVVDLIQNNYKANARRAARRFKHTIYPDILYNRNNRNRFYRIRCTR